MKKVRKILVPVIAFVLTLSGVTLTPAQAALPANGKYDCNTGLRTTGTPNYTISIGVVEEGRSCVGDVILPSGVTAIGENAFYFAQQVESVYIPASVITIHYYAFQSAFSLATVTFAPGSKLEVIEDYAFQSTAIRGISIPASVWSIGRGAFLAAGSLESITIPAQVTSIESDTFRQATSLHTVLFAPGSKLTNIEERAFKGATTLTNITFPNSLSSIGLEAFLNTTSLNTLTFPTNLTEIGESAFSGSSLISVTIPAKVVSVGSFAFFSSEDLQSVFILGKPEIGDQAFDGTFANGEILNSPPSPSLTNYIFTGWAVSHGSTRITFPYKPNLSKSIILYTNWKMTAAFAAAQAAAKDLAARTIWALDSFNVKALAKKVGVKIVSSKATVSIQVSSSSKKVCSISSSKLKTIKKGKCIVTLIVQEPKPKTGKKPKATKTVKTLVVIWPWE